MSLAKRKLAYRVDEFCDALAISRTTVYKYISQNKIPVIKVGTRTLIPTSVLHEIIRGERVLDDETVKPLAHRVPEGTVSFP
jgi:excisionase family DNA binding protein